MRPEVRRNLWFNLAEHCRDAGVDHAADYRFIGPRHMPRVVRVVIVGALLALAAVAIAVWS